MFHGISHRSDGEGLAYSPHWQDLPRDLQKEIFNLVGGGAKPVLRQISKSSRDVIDNDVRRLVINDARVIETIHATGRFPNLREIRFLQKKLLSLSDLPVQLTHVDAGMCEKISADALRTLIKQPWTSLSVNRATVSLKEFVDSSKASLNEQEPSGYFLGKGGVELSNGEAARLMIFEGLMALSSRGRKINAADVLSFASIRGLKELKLGSNLLPVVRNEVDYQGLAALLKNTSLTSLDVFGIRLLKEGDVTVLGNALAANKSLTRLNMGDIGVHADEGLDDDIAASLSRSTTLLSLGIAGNHFSNAGMECVASMKTLTELDASLSFVGMKGLLALVSNTSIKRLRLDVNAISSDLVKAFVEKGKLTSLSLQACQLNAEVLPHLWRSQSLVELDLGLNFSREQLMNMPAHPSLRRLSIRPSPTLRAIDVMTLKNNGLISARTTLDFNYAQVNAALNREELQAIAGAANFYRIDSLKICGAGFAGGNLGLLPRGLKTLHLISLGKLAENDLRPLRKQLQLEQLTMVGMEVDDAGLALLASLKSLRHLEFRDV